MMKETDRSVHISKAARTRGHIIEKAAQLFNQRGYAGTSMAELMTATGLKKGGIYNHFVSKDELAIAAFDYGIRLASRRHVRALKGKQGSSKKLQAMVAAFADSFETISAWGGCPLMNTAIDSDDAHPALRERAQQAMDDWRYLIRRIIQKGIKAGELLPSTDADAVATITIATLEGALMLAKLYGDRTHLDRAKTHLHIYIDSLHARL